MSDLLSALDEKKLAPATSSTIMELLRRHYLPENRQPGGVFAPEIQAPNSDRRADLIWMPTTIAGGTGLIGHEVKVSRADVLRELEEPAKADPWAQYCTRWWLVVSSPALVEGLDVPEAWGIMAPPSGRRTRSMTILRPAPKLDPRDSSLGFRRVASWQMYRVEKEINRLRSDRNSWERTAKLAQQETETLRLGGARRDPDALRLAGILTKARSQIRREHIFEDIDDDSIVAALVDTAAARRAATEFRWALQSKLRATRDLLDIGRFKDIAADLAKMLESTSEASEGSV